MENHYTDTDGKEKILYHNGYVNYTETMKKVMEQAGIPGIIKIEGSIRRQWCGL